MSENNEKRQGVFDFTGQHGAPRAKRRKGDQESKLESRTEDRGAEEDAVDFHKIVQKGDLTKLHNALQRRPYTGINRFVLAYLRNHGNDESIRSQSVA